MSKYEPIEPIGPITPPPRRKAGRPRKPSRPVSPDKLSHGEVLRARIRLKKVQNSEKFKAMVLEAYSQAGLKTNGQFAQERGTVDDLPKVSFHQAKLSSFSRSGQKHLVRNADDPDPHALDHLITVVDNSITSRDLPRPASQKKPVPPADDDITKAVDRKLNERRRT